MIVLDTETTGFSPNDDRIIEVAILSFDDSVVLFHSLINPGIHIPEAITKITGISDIDVLSAPSFEEVAKEIGKIIAETDAVAGHNVFFDRGMLSAELNRCNAKVLWPTLICTKRLWDVYEPKKRNLQSAFKRFVDKGGFEGAHGAMQDTMACLKILRAQLKEFQLEEKEWSELDPEASTWWGPSNHVILKDGQLVFNIGKHKGRVVHEIDMGYWGWVAKKDFPEHVTRLADYLVHVSSDPAKYVPWAKGEK